LVLQDLQDVVGRPLWVVPILFILSVLSCRYAAVIRHVPFAPRPRVGFFHPFGFVARVRPSHVDGEAVGVEDRCTSRALAEANPRGLAAGPVEAAVVFLAYMQD
jgi:hypothetical protein